MAASLPPLHSHYQLAKLVNLQDPGHPSFKGRLVIHSNFTDAQSTAYVQYMINDLHEVVSYGEFGIVKWCVSGETNPLKERYNNWLHVLTALVIKGHETAIALLLKYPYLIDVNAKDKRGMTALHHAAIANRPTIQAMLIRAKASPLIKSNRAGTPKDYRVMCHPTFGPPNEHGFVETNEVHYSAQMIAQDWVRPMVKREDYQRDMSTLQPPTNPRFSLIKPKKNEIGEDVPDIGICTVVVEAVEIHQTLWIYSGMPTTEDHEVTHSMLTPCKMGGRMIKINALEYGNAASRMADGRPQVLFITVSNYRGAPFALAVCAAEAMKPGTLVTADYGILDTVKDHFYDLYPKTNRAMLKELARAPQKTSSHYALASFLFQTPSLLLDLIIDGSLTYKEIISIYDWCIESLEGDAILYAKEIQSAMAGLDLSRSNEQIQSLFAKAKAILAPSTSRKTVYVIFFHLSKTIREYIKTTEKFDITDSQLLEGLLKTAEDLS